MSSSRSTCGRHYVCGLWPWLVVAVVGESHVRENPIGHDNVVWREFEYHGDCRPVPLVVGGGGNVEGRLALRQGSDDTATQFSAPNALEDVRRPGAAFRLDKAMPSR